ncbi:MAG TPA: SH3 domain-containing protein [Devosia sp.]|nr:SH3 domain-containing protein [Devosia sp.]
MNKPLLSRRHALRLALLLPAALALPSGARAVEKNEDGLPLPRFASTRSAPINVRVGPGQKYDIAWIYNRPDMPVEITAEFDIWRKVRDFDGSEGWIQQNLLSGARTGLVAPWKQDTETPLLASANDKAAVRAYLGSGFRVDIKRCDGSWCEVTATAELPDGGRGASYSGFLKQADIWGVYEGEVF